VFKIGVKLGGLVEAKKLSIENLSGRTIAFDGNNILYQFLSIIRGPTGEPLKDREGHITSHLSGLIYRNSNLIEAGIKIVYVFDGKPHQFKSKVLRSRKQVRSQAKEKYEKAVKEGNIEEARRYGQRSIVATTDLISDAKRLLSLMGIPWIQAPGEGEAQSSYLTLKGDVWGAASQDFDSLLFGSSRLIRNLSITGRRKIPRKNIYVKVEPELIELERYLKELELTREQLIDVAILVGTDYNPKGIRGIGPKTAIKLIRKHENIEAAIPHIKNPNFPHPVEEIRALFLNPRVTDKYELKWEKPDRPGILTFLCGERGFGRTRVLKAIEKIDSGFNKTRERVTLERWFG